MKNKNIKKIISSLSNTLDASEAAFFLKNLAERHLKRAYPPNPYDSDRFDYQWYKYASTTQSTIFYADILPVLAEYLIRQPRGSTFRLLDVGGATGAGVT